MSPSVFASAICGKYTQEVGCKFLTEDESTLFYESSLSQLKLYGVKKKSFLNWNLQYIQQTIRKYVFICSNMSLIKVTLALHCEYKQNTPSFSDSRFYYYGVFQTFFSRISRRLCYFMLS